MVIETEYQSQPQPIKLKTYPEWGNETGLYIIPGGILARFENKTSAVYEIHPNEKMQYPTNWQHCEPNGLIEKGLVGTLAIKQAQAI